MRWAPSLVAMIGWSAAQLAGAQPARRPPERPAPVEHQPIYLRTETGAIIDPVHGQNASEPYSPASTCGASKCHDYAVITRAYHFDAGGSRYGHPPEGDLPGSQSPGMFGRYLPAVLHQLGTRNRHPAALDLTVWQFVVGTTGARPPCAACHPGGGPLERDRAGTRYDRKPAKTEEANADYLGAHWKAAGVLEADCLMCHLPAYDWDIRVRHLRRGNLRFAATAAAKIGSVTGAVYDAERNMATGQQPKVTYNRRLFNEDGTVVLKLRARPHDRNCLQCHAQPGLNKRGFTWADEANPDIHQQQGLGCVDCHASGLDHNFAKGKSVVETLRDDLDGTITGCRGCHSVGKRGATVPGHNALPPSHLRKISCKTCHIPVLHRSPATYFDMTRGVAHWDVVMPGHGVGRKKDWYPAYEMRDGRIVPVNPVPQLWWANRARDGSIQGLFPRELQAAWRRYRHLVRDDNHDGEPEVNSPEEIAAGLKALRATLRGNPRFDRIEPVYIKGSVVWRLGPDDKPLSERDEGFGPLRFSISHNVSPAQEALGAKGCIDCHASDGRFFGRTYLVDPYDASGKEVRAPVRRTIGLSDFSYTVFSVYWSLMRPWIGVVLMVVFFVVMLHFTRFGPHDFGGAPPSPRADDVERIKRFTAFERILHLVVLLTFLFLAFTGLAFSFNGWRWMQLVFGDNVTPRDWHGWLGFVFGGGVVLMTLRWWRDALLAKGDKTWFKELGGYFGSHQPVPAERFNAGQKLYFWTVVLGGVTLLGTGIILYFQESFSLNFIFFAAILHNLAGIFGVAGVLSHIYLSTAANPGTSQAIFAGWVTRGWARLHHPLWYERVRSAEDRNDTQGEGTSEPAAAQEQTGDDGKDEIER